MVSHWWDTGRTVGARWWDGGATVVGRWWQRSVTLVGQWHETDETDLDRRVEHRVTTSPRMHFNHHPCSDMSQGAVADISVHDDAAGAYGYCSFRS